MNPGNVQFIRVVKIFGESFDIAGLGEHVQFPENIALKFLHQIYRTDDATDFKGIFYFFGEIIHQADIFANLFVDTGPDNLYRYFFAVFQFGQMNLRDRGGG